MNIFFKLLDFILTLADLAVQLLDFLLVFLDLRFQFLLSGIRLIFQVLHFRHDIVLIETAHQRCFK